MVQVKKRISVSKDNHYDSSNHFLNDTKTEFNSPQSIGRCLGDLEMLSLIDFQNKKLKKDEEKSKKPKPLRASIEENINNS